MRVAYPNDPRILTPVDCSAVYTSQYRVSKDHSSSLGFIRKKIITPIKAKSPKAIQTMTQVWPRKSVIAPIESSLSSCDE